MRQLLRVLFCGLVITLLLQPKVSDAQWTQTASQIVVGSGGVIYDGGCLTYCDGILWAGDTQIVMSRDSGVTWETRSGPFKDDEIKDIVFFDSLNGAFSVYDNGIYITTDQGRTWIHSLKNPDTIHNNLATQGITFLGDPNHIVCASHTENEAYRTSDGGQTWDTLPIPVTWIHSVIYDNHGRTIMVGGTDTYGFIIESDDDFSDWQFHTVTNNSWSGAIDSCNKDLIYVLSEDIGVDNATTTDFYVSTDGGAHFHTTFSKKIPYLTGGIAESKNVIYLQTDSSGILRSTDHGETWVSIGGPNHNPDTRLISAIDDNIVIAIDRQGNVWRTTNSGGDSVAGPTEIAEAIVQTPFKADTLQGCSDITVMVPIAFSQCSQLQVIDEQILGPDSSWYSITQSLPNTVYLYDSAFITLSMDASQIAPGVHKPLNARFYAAFSNNTSVTVDLSSNAIGPAGSVELVPVSLSVDTIGATIRLPIVLHCTNAIDSVMFRLSYDSSDLSLVGFDTTPSANFVLRDSGFDHCSITLTNLTNASDTVAYALFIPIPVHAGCSQITEDSLVPFAQESICQVRSSPSMLCYTCGSDLLGGLMRTGTMPFFRSFPNPASNNLTIECPAALSASQFDLLDQLGRIAGSISFDDGANNLALDISTLSDGIYFLKCSQSPLILPVSIMH